jgi:predicted metal-dependent peptidase
MEATQAKDTGTVTELPARLEATPEQIARFRMDDHLINLMLEEPFFSQVMVKLNKEETDSIPTAGVMVKDCTPILVWNPSFVAALDKLKVRGLLKHECYHLIFSHCTRRKKDPHRVWNFATDLAINSIIPRHELPDGGLFPGEALDLSRITDPERLAKWKKVSDLIESLPAEMAADWYFGKLMEDPEVSETIEESQGGGGEPGDMDDHDGWGDMSDEEREVVEGRIKQALAEATKRCDANGQWGSVPSQIQSRIREMVSNEVDWRALLRSFVGRTQRAHRSSTMKRINRKYPYVHPGRKRGHSAHVAIYMDQSGSVSDENLALLFGELNNLGRLVQFTLIPFDSSVDTENELEWRRGQKLPPRRWRSGGTNFDAVARHAEENSHRFDGYIVLTDGECSDPGPSRMRRAWVIVPGHKLYFTPHPKDTVIQMKKNRGV